jgi:hypothetical protein
MKIKPILYSTEMVQSLLKGIKNHTRRIKGLEIINKNPNFYRYNGPHKRFDEYIKSYHIFNNGAHFIKCPYNIGDILWVRESFWNITYAGTSKKSFIYRADLTDDAASLVTWKPSIHMPKEAARIFLKITDVRAERLNDISQADAISEGIKKSGNLYFDYMRHVDGLPKESFFRELDPRLSFMSLWCKINGVDSWISNPWVWVIEFRHTNKPENF